SSRARSGAPISRTGTPARSWTPSATRSCRSATERRSCAAMAPARPLGSNGIPTRLCARLSAAVGRAAALGLALLLWAAWIRPAQAWGALGHEAIALVAESLLQPDVRRRVDAILAADTDPLTAHDIASAATWADTYRQADIDGSRTRKWHYVDIELDAPSLDAACFRHVPLPP